MTNVIDVNQQNDRGHGPVLGLRSNSH